MQHHTSFLVFVTAVGCAAAEVDVEPVPRASPAGTDRSPDAGGLDASMSMPMVVDGGADRSDVGGVDAGRPDGQSDATSDASGPCIVGAEERRACGACGTSSRRCLASGVWSTFGDCFEPGAVECRIGDKRTELCGKCGIRADACDPLTCRWSRGVCEGEGACTPGETERTNVSCASSSSTRARTCDATCNWNAWSSCGAAGSWMPMPSPTFLRGRDGHSAVWTGTRMLVWGGSIATSGTIHAADGGAYEPVSRAWTRLANAPLAPRRAHCAAFGDGKMFVWGGRATQAFADGASYTPTTDTWSTLAPSLLSARYAAAAIWSSTTNELLIWGGCTDDQCRAVVGDGAAYDPKTNSWTSMPPAPLSARSESEAFWTGTEFLVFGGYDARRQPLADGARYDPTTRRWTSIPTPPATILEPRHEASVVWLGDGLIVWGGSLRRSGTTYQAGGALYKPSTGWSTIADAPAAILGPEPRRVRSAAWAVDGILHVFSGADAKTGSTGVAGSAAYDPSTRVWTMISRQDEPQPRVYATVVWTGTEAIVFGGRNDLFGSNFLVSGGRYVP